MLVHGSEFQGHAVPVAVDEAEAVIASVREEHADATHTVPAYRVRDGAMLREYASNEGEPAGSAGKPTLNVLV